MAYILISVIIIASREFYEFRGRRWEIADDALIRFLRNFMESAMRVEDEHRKEPEKDEQDDDRIPITCGSNF